MEIRIRSTGQLLTLAQWKVDNPLTALPEVVSKEMLDGFGIDVVLAAPQPAATAFQSVVRNGAEQNGNGDWVQAWQVLDWPQAQIDAYKASAKAARWDAIKTERDQRKAGGVLVNGKWFHSDDASRIQHIGLVMMGDSIPVGLQWKAMDGSFVPMTRELANQIFLAVVTLDQGAFLRAEQHRLAMEASADPGAYDFSAGWPATYPG